MNLSGELNYDKYPLIIDGKEPKWVDSVRPHNSYLSGWGGDYDGDMISIKGLFTQEANEEVEALLKSPSTLLSAGGSASRVVGKEAILSLYMLTK